MTVHIYHCETATMRSEMVQRSKPDGIFYGLRLHFNTDQTITFWHDSTQALYAMAHALMTTTLTQPVEVETRPGQFARQP